MPFRNELSQIDNTFIVEYHKILNLSKNLMVFFCSKSQILTWLHMFVIHPKTKDCTKMFHVKHFFKQFLQNQ